MTGRVLTLVAAVIPILAGRGLAGDDAPRRVRPVDARLLAWGKYSIPKALAVGPDGCPVVAGMTGWARDLPLRNPVQVRWCDNADAWILKLDPTGTRVVFGTFLGGSHMDEIKGLAVGPDGTVFAMGTTLSRDFPATPGAIRVQREEPDRLPGYGFLARIDPEEGRFVYSTFLGPDLPTAMAVGPDGSAYLVGTTEGPAVGLPSVRSPWRHEKWVPYACRVAPDGKSFLWRVALDDTGPADMARTLVEPAAVAVAADGGAVVTGSTDSPTFPGARPPTIPGGRFATRSAFAVGLDSGGKALYSRLVAEGSFSSGTDLAVDAAGDAWVVGEECAGTFAWNDNSPWKGKEDPRRSRIFVERLDRGGRRLSRCVVEGDVGERNPSIALRPGGAWVAGRTASPGFAGIPADADLGPIGRRFVAAVDAQGKVEDAFHVPLSPDLHAAFAASPTGDLFVCGTFGRVTPGVPGPGESHGAHGWIVRCSLRDEAASGSPGDPWTLARVPGWKSLPGSGGVDVASAEAKSRTEREGAASGVEEGSEDPGGASGGTTTADPGGRGASGGASADPTIEIHRGVLRDRTEAGQDVFRLEARLFGETTPAAGLDVFDPATKPLRITAGDLLYPFVLEIWPGDPGWVERREILVWKSPEEGPFRARLRIHRESGRFDLEVSGFDFPGPQRNPVQVKVEEIEPLGEHLARWSVAGEGVMKYR